MVVRDMALWVRLTMIWQNWLGNRARWWNIPNQGQPNPCPRPPLSVLSPCSILKNLKSRITTFVLTLTTTSQTTLCCVQSEGASKD